MGVDNQPYIPERALILQMFHALACEVGVTADRHPRANVIETFCLCHRSAIQISWSVLSMSSIFSQV